MTAVDHLALAVQDRELLTIVGPSGCGKTTTLRLIAGLESPDAGRILFDDQPVTALPPAARDVAMVFQSHALFPHFSAFDNIALGLTLRRVSRAEIHTRVRETADWLGITPCLDRKPGKLSGGERQRVALGRALVRRPGILLLDEPFSNLDEPLRAQLRSELLALRARLGMTVIYVTHDQAEALALGDRVAVLSQGQLQQIGSPREIYEAPANRFVAGFVGSPPMNLVPGTVGHQEGRFVLLGAGTTADATSGVALQLGPWRTDWFSQNIGRSVLLGVRPEAVNLADANADPDRSVRATVQSGQYQGAATLLHLMAGGHRIVAWTRSTVSFPRGHQVTVTFDFTHARLYDGVTGVLIF